MKSVKFIYELQSPLAYSIDNSHYQQRFIFLGSLLRGGLAPLYLNTYGEDERFARIFIHGNNRFPVLLPANSEKQPIALAPFTTGACKRHGIKHSVVSYLKELRDDKANENKKEEEEELLESCKVCGNDLKSYTNFLEEYPLQSSLMAHTAIHKGTNTALPHAYYREILISPKKQETVYLCGYGQLCEESFVVLQTLCQDNLVMLGKSCSRGKGWGKLTIEEETPPIRRSTQGLQSDEFTLLCKSPVILLDDFLRPTKQLSLTWQGETIFPFKWKTSTQSITGWSAIHALPKVEDVAIEMGSVYLFQRPDFLKNDKVFQEFITTIEQQGVGERRIEGFGQVSINEAVITQPGDYVNVK